MPDKICYSSHDLNNGLFVSHRCLKYHHINNVVGISYEVQTSVGAEGDEYVGLGKMLGESTSLTSLTSLGEMALADDGFTDPQSGLSV